MNEPGSHYDGLNPEGMKLLAEMYKEKVEYALMYTSEVSPEKHNASLAKCAEFTAAALSYLCGKPEFSLRPLHLTKDQLEIAQNLKKAASGKNLHRESVEVRYHGKKPYIVTHYMTNDQNVYLTVRWGVFEPFPHGFVLRDGTSRANSIDFITFPMRPGTSQEVRMIFESPEVQDRFTRSTQVIDEGRELVFGREGEYEEEYFKQEHRYRLLTLLKLKSGGNYWLYGDYAASFLIE